MVFQLCFSFLASNAQEFNIESSEKLYILNQVSNSVIVIDLEQNDILKTIEVGEMPVHQSVSPKRSQILVTNRGSNSLTVINTENDRVTRTIPLAIANHCLQSSLFKTESKILVGLLKLINNVKHLPIKVCFLNLSSSTIQLDTLFNLASFRTSLDDWVMIPKYDLLAIKCSVSSRFDAINHYPFYLVNLKDYSILSTSVSSQPFVVSPDQKIFMRVVCAG